MRHDYKLFRSTVVPTLPVGILSEDPGRKGGFVGKQMKRDAGASLPLIRSASDLQTDIFPEHHTFRGFQNRNILGCRIDGSLPGIYTT